MFKDLDTLREQIQAFKLNRLEEKIVSLAQPSICMTRESREEKSLPLGASKFGGLPDLPSDFQWPYSGSKPLTFIGQFRLSEVAPFDVNSILPKHGMLYYFYDADEDLWTENPDNWKLVYLEDESSPLFRTSHPTYAGDNRQISSLPIYRIEYSTGYSLPIIFAPEVADFDINFVNLPGDDSDPDNPTEHPAYFDLLDANYPEPRHHWLGNPWRKQQYINWDVVTISEKIRPQKIGVNNYRYSAEQITHIQSEMENWQFLFQIDSDDSLNIGWGDSGTLYICIPKTSLAARRFEDCWTIMQCY